MNKQIVKYCDVKVITPKSVRHCAMHIAQLHRPGSQAVKSPMMARSCSGFFPPSQYPWHPPSLGRNGVGYRSFGIWGIVCPF